MRTGCIKTGCIVHFPQYDQILSVDVYRVGDCLVLKAHANQIGGDSGREVCRKPDLTISSNPFGYEFWGNDIGVIVLQESDAQWANPDHP